MMDDVDMPALSSAGAASQGSEPKAEVRQIWFRAARIACLVAPLIGITIALQWFGNAYSSNFGVEEPDEPAHYVTGLMVHDYVAKGFPAKPLQFARDYYLHYPKVALGVWPPFFYVIEAAWMLIFSSSRASVLLLSASITVSSALILLFAVRAKFGDMLAFLMAAAYILLPAVQTSTQSVMIDGLVALLDLLAVLQFGLYLDRGKTKYAYAFGVFGALAALTKANSLALVLVPAIVIAITRRWRLLYRKEIWLALLIIAVAAAPWNLFLIQLAAHSASLIRKDGLFAFDRAGSYLRTLGQVAGVFLILALPGVWTTIVRPFRGKRASGFWASLLALIVAGFLFHTVVPANVVEPRYLLPCLVPVLLFGAAGLHSIARDAPLKDSLRKWGAAAVVSITAIAFFVFQFHIPRRDQPGFDSTAQRLAQVPTPQAILVSGNSSLEGMAVSEIAMRDVRPRHFVLRSTKVLSASDWNGQGYRSRFERPQEISEYLESVPVDYVLTSDASGENNRLHHRLLLEALRSHPEVWRIEPTGGPFSLWERVHPIAHGTPKFSVDMNYTFNSSFSSGESNSPRAK